MNINRSNYEVYFLDYLDGNLPEDRIDYFLDFLSDNPDLREELEEISAIKITAGSHTFRNKQALLKDELTGSTTFDSRAVAFLENDLPEEDQTAFLNELSSNPEKEKQFGWFLKTKLQADTTIVFPDKASLRKKPARKIILFWGSRVAAALVLLVAVWGVWDFSPEPDSAPRLAHEQAVISSQEESPEDSQPAHPTSEKQNEQQLLAQQQQGPVNKPAEAIQPIIPVQSKFQTNELIVQREEVPEKLESIASQLEHTPVAEPLALVEMKAHKAKSNTDYLTVDEYLAQKVLNKPKDEPLTFGSLLSAGLDAVASVSNDRLEYETNARGKVSEISLNTRILAFSIPLKKDQ
jgi:hypothetical protein